MNWYWSTMDPTDETWSMPSLSIRIRTWFMSTCPATTVTNWLWAGLALCRGERIFILDADLQDPPELLSTMMAAIDDGADVAYGQREQREGETAFKKVAAYLFYRIMNLIADQHIPEDTGDFRLITRRVLRVFSAMPESHRFIRGMINWVGFKQVGIPYRRPRRAAGETKYTLRRMAGFALDAITVFL
jgi:dolichol-phosphate mannosyltransferase